MEELKIIINQELGTISTNFEEVKETLTNQMSIYNELKVTESNKPERKKDVATLRKMVKAVNQKRADVKNECLKPYMTFEEKARELIQIINEPIDIIDSQVKEFEEAQRVEKIVLIKSIYSELIGDLIGYVSLEQLHDSKWENATCSKKTVKDEMSAKISNINQSVSVIKGMVSDKTEDALDIFYTDLNLPNAINMITRYENQKKEIQARIEKQQELDREKEVERQRIARERELEHERERVRADERARINAENKIIEDARRKAQEEQEEKVRVEREAMEVQRQSEMPMMISSTYVLTATVEELDQVEMYLNSLGIEFERNDF